MTEFKDLSFVHWAVERDKVRVARASGVAQPWTEDPIIRDYRFCNVSREDDRVTLYVKHKIRDPWNEAGDPEQLFLALCIARFFNLEESLDVLLDEGVMVPGEAIDLHAVHDALQHHKDANRKNRVFNSAYLIGAPDNHRTYEFGTEKVAYVCGVLKHAKLPDVCTKPPHLRTREEFVKQLNKEFGFKSFMSGQIAADAAYTDLLGQASDHMTWAPYGPGAVRGMNRALGRPLNSKLTEAEYLQVAKDQLARLPQSLVDNRELTLHDIASNVNCETDKYLRIKNQEDKYGNYVGKVAGMRRFNK